MIEYGVAQNITRHLGIDYLTVSGQIRKDGSGLVALSGVVAFISSGDYMVPLAAAEMQATEVMVKLSAPGMQDDVFILYPERNLTQARIANLDNLDAKVSDSANPGDAMALTSGALSGIAANFPANFADMLIGQHTGLVSVGAVAAGVVTAVQNGLATTNSVNSAVTNISGVVVNSVSGIVFPSVIDVSSGSISTIRSGLSLGTDVASSTNALSGIITKSVPTSIDINTGSVSTIRSGLALGTDVTSSTNILSGIIAESVPTSIDVNSESISTIRSGLALGTDVTSSTNTLSGIITKSIPTSIDVNSGSVNLIRSGLATQANINMISGITNGVQSSINDMRTTDLASIQSGIDRTVRTGTSVPIDNTSISSIRSGLAMQESLNTVGSGIQSTLSDLVTSDEFRATASGLASASGLQWIISNVSTASGMQAAIDATRSDISGIRVLNSTNMDEIRTDVSGLQGAISGIDITDQITTVLNTIMPVTPTIGSAFDQLRQITAGSTGNGTMSLPVHFDIGGVPVAGVGFWITGDVDGVDDGVVVAGTAYTDAGGNITFRVNPGWCWIHWSKPGEVNYGEKRYEVK